MTPKQKLIAINVLRNEARSARAEARSFSLATKGTTNESHRRNYTAAASMHREIATALYAAARELKGMK